MKKLIEKYEAEVLKLKASEKNLLSYNDYENSEKENKEIDSALISIRVQKAIFEGVILDLKFEQSNANV